jgi:hypothetical protein
MSHYNLDVDEVGFEGDVLVLKGKKPALGTTWEFRLRASEVQDFWKDIGIKKKETVDIKITATEDLKKHGLKISKR